MIKMRTNLDCPGEETPRDGSRGVHLGEPLLEPGTGE